MSYVLATGRRSAIGNRYADRRSACGQTALPRRRLVSVIRLSLLIVDLGRESFTRSRGRPWIEKSKDPVRRV